MSVSLEKLRREDGRISIDDGLASGALTCDDYEPTGARKKFWLNNFSYMYKEIFQNSYEDYAELIAEEIAKVFGIEMANYDLASHEGKNGVITKNFVDDEKEEFITGTSIIQHVYHSYILPIKDACEKYNELMEGINVKNLLLEDKKNILKEISKIFNKCNINQEYYRKITDIDSYENFSDKDANNLLELYENIFSELNIMYDFEFEKGQNDELKVNNLFDLWSIIENYLKLEGYDHKKSSNLIKGLATIFMYDILTLQGDRHSENWGIIINHETGEVRLAPIFDNSNIFNLNRIKALKSILQNIDAFNEINNKNPNKTQRTYDRLTNQIYHPSILLKVMDGSNKALCQLEKFIEVSDEEFIQSFINKLELLENEIYDIFKRVEEKTKTEMPEEIKKVVIDTIKINKAELLKRVDSRRR